MRPPPLDPRMIILMCNTLLSREMTHKTFIFVQCVFKIGKRVTLKLAFVKMLFSKNVRVT